MRKPDLWILLLPYAVMVILFFVSERVLLAPVASNLSDVGRATTEQIYDNIKFYWKLIYNYLNILPSIDLKFTGYIFTVACVAGIILKGIKENLHLTLLLVGTLIVDVMLPYEQGLRYLYNILPIIMMFTAYGLQIFYRWFCMAASIPQIFRIYAMACAVAMLLIMPLYNIAMIGHINRNSELADSDVYSAEAVDMYRYI